VSNARLTTIVERDAVAVMFARVADEQEAITRAWADLEARVGSLHGRRFYGLFDAGTGEYRVCVETRDGDDPEALGLEPGIVPGGRYARVRLQGEPPAIYGQVAPTFKWLARRADHDPGRPEIEFYRRRDVIYLLTPVR
jgi:hypothetical protein